MRRYPEDLQQNGHSVAANLGCRHRGTTPASKQWAKLSSVRAPKSRRYSPQPIFNRDQMFRNAADVCSSLDHLDNLPAAQGSGARRGQSTTRRPSGTGLGDRCGENTGWATTRCPHASRYCRYPTACDQVTDGLTSGVVYMSTLVASLLLCCCSSVRGCC